MRMKWLHLSDIHFNFKNYESHDLREDFIARISILNQSEPFTHLFLTGDVLYRYNSADCETIEFIKRIIEVLSIPIENVIIVPGNHDHYRDVVISQLASLPDQSDRTIDGLDQPFRASLLTAFASFDEVYKELFGSGYYKEYDNPHSIYNTESITVIKLNTAWLDTDSSNDPSLRIGSRQLQLLLSAANENIQSTVNIAVGHHPLQTLSTYERNRILALFKKHNIGLYFCGHSHRADIKVYSTHDVIEIVAPGGFVDNENYSVGGYVWGIIDTDTDFYKAEIYNWNNGKWGIDSTIPGTDDHGIFYFNTSRFSNSSEVVAVDLKTMGSHIAKKQLIQSIGFDNFDVHTYCGPYGDPSGYSEEIISDFSDIILQLSEKGKTVHLYPLAPIPMLLTLGFKLQKSTQLFVHQYDRNADKWVYEGTSDPISITHTSYLKNNNILAVSISTSFTIPPASVSKALNGKPYDYLEFKSDHIEAGYPLYHRDINNAVRTIVGVLSPIVNNYSAIHVFAAIPAGLAIELGRNLLKSVFHNIHTYQFAEGKYIPDIVINKCTTSVENDIVSRFTLNSDNIAYIPILGRIPCGPLKQAIVESDYCFPMPESILPNGDYYILEARGDSMIEAGIEDGDYVLIRRKPDAQEGEIVVALIEGETTIKRIHFDDINKSIVLKPENSRYEAHSYKNLDIQGVAIRVIKKL